MMFGYFLFGLLYLFVPNVQPLLALDRNINGQNEQINGSRLYASVINGENEQINGSQFDAAYTLYLQPRTWFDAREQCKENKESLLVIESEEEAKFIFEHAQSRGVKRLHSGITDIQIKHHYMTEEGVPLMAFSYKWGKGQPDGYSKNGSREDCVGYLIKDGSLHDYRCVKKRTFICKSKLKLEDTAYCNYPYSDFEYNRALKKCYKMHHLVALDWANAQMVCKSQGAHLAVIDDKDEEELYSEVMKDENLRVTGWKHRIDKVHVGFHKQFGRDYETVLGTPLHSITYQNWHKPETNKDCGSMLRNGKLKAVDCDYKSPFMCETSVATEIVQPKPIQS